MRVLYGTAFDAVIAIDGYNEAFGFGFDTPLFRVNTNEYADLSGYLKKSPAFYFYRAILKFKRHTEKLNAKKSYFAFWFFRSAIRGLSGAVYKDNFVRNPYFAFKAFPLGDSVRARRWNKQKYEEMLRLQFSYSQLQHNRFVQFIQPFKQIGKKLTARESLMIDPVNLELADEIIFKTIKKLRSEGLPAFDLLHVFDAVQGDIYQDQIHCISDFDNDKSDGYEIISKNIVERLSQVWHLKKRSKI
jgi:hypothetical protein